MLPKLRPSPKTFTVLPGFEKAQSRESYDACAEVIRNKYFQHNWKSIFRYLAFRSNAILPLAEIKIGDLKIWSFGLQLTFGLIINAWPLSGWPLQGAANHWFCPDVILSVRLKGLQQLQYLQRIPQWIPLMTMNVIEKNPNKLTSVLISTISLK